MRQLLQNATILLQNVTFITKCDIYYKMRHLLQIALFNLIEGVGWRRGGGRAIPILWKNFNPLALFPFIN